MLIIDFELTNDIKEPDREYRQAGFFFQAKIYLVNISPSGSS